MYNSTKYEGIVTPDSSWTFPSTTFLFVAIPSLPAANNAEEHLSKYGSNRRRCCISPLMLAKSYSIDKLQLK